MTYRETSIRGLGAGCLHVTEGSGPLTIHVVGGCLKPRALGRAEVTRSASPAASSRGSGGYVGLGVGVHHRQHAA